MCFDEMFHDGQAEPRPARVAGARLVHPIEPFEYSRAIGLGNSRPVIEYVNGLPQRPCGEHTPTGTPNYEEAQA